jgi:hypothetical protein
VHVAVDHRDDPPLPSGDRGQVTAEDALRLRHGAIESTPWAQLVHRTPFAMVNQKQNKSGKHWDAICIHYLPELGRVVRARIQDWIPALKVLINIRGTGILILVSP